VLKWMRENGCPWNEDACTWAAAKGRLEVLQWLWQNGCPWNQKACLNATRGHFFEVFQWIKAYLK